MADGKIYELYENTIARETFRYLDDHLSGGDSSLDLSVAKWEFIPGKTTKKIKFKI